VAKARADLVALFIKQGESLFRQKREPIVTWGRQALCRRGEMGFCGLIATNVPQRQQINGLIV
jgi:hypothetical protein